jgi:hypothetical protein
LLKYTFIIFTAYLATSWAYKWAAAHRLRTIVLHGAFYESHFTCVLSACPCFTAWEEQEE